jgi:hypothetical protein
MRSLRICLVTCLALFGAVSAVSAQDVTPAVPEPQAIPTPFPTIPSDLDPPAARTTPALSPVPTRTPTKVLAAEAATPGPDMTVAASRPRKKEAAASAKGRRNTEPPASKETEPVAGSAAAAAPVVAGPTGGEPPWPPGAAPPKPADSDALAPLPPPPETEAVTPAAVVDRSAHVTISPWILFGGVFLGVAAVMVTLVTRRKPDLVLHITD